MKTQQVLQSKEKTPGSYFTVWCLSTCWTKRVERRLVPLIEPGYASADNGTQSQAAQLLQRAAEKLCDDILLHRNSSRSIHEHKSTIASTWKNKSLRQCPVLVSSYSLRCRNPGVLFSALLYTILCLVTFSYVSGYILFSILLYSPMSVARFFFFFLLYSPMEVARYYPLSCYILPCQWLNIILWQVIFSHVTCYILPCQ